MRQWRCKERGGVDTELEDRGKRQCEGSGGRLTPNTKFPIWKSGKVIITSMKIGRSTGGVSTEARKIFTSFHRVVFRVQVRHQWRRRGVASR